MYWILKQEEQTHFMEKSIWRRLWTCHKRTTWLWTCHKRTTWLWTCHKRTTWLRRNSVFVLLLRRTWWKMTAVVASLRQMSPPANMIDTLSSSIPPITVNSVTQIRHRSFLAYPFLYNMHYALYFQL
jgi:hypothetical protein